MTSWPKKGGVGKGRSTFSSPSFKFETIGRHREKRHTMEYIALTPLFEHLHHMDVNPPRLEVYRLPSKNGEKPSLLSTSEAELTIGRCAENKEWSKTTIFVQINEHPYEVSPNVWANYCCVMQCLRVRPGTRGVLAEMYTTYRKRPGQPNDTTQLVSSSRDWRTETRPVNLASCR
jgi:hypothetical protein